MLIALTHQATGESYSSMVSTFGGWYSAYTYPIHYFINHLYRKYYHLTSGDSLTLWTRYIDTFREAIWKKTSFNSNGLNDVSIKLEHFWVFIF